MDDTIYTVFYLNFVFLFFIGISNSFLLRIQNILLSYLKQDRLPFLDENMQFTEIIFVPLFCFPNRNIEFFV